MPTTSVSWKASLPSRSELTWPVMTTRGVLSSVASLKPVMTLVAAGPEVTTTTPVLPLTRAKPCAAWIAPCSWRVSTWVRLSV